MVLSDKQIHQYIAKRDLVFVAPNIAPFNPYTQVQPSSVDLRIGSRIIRFKKDISSFDLKEIENVKDYLIEEDIKEGGKIVLEPNDVINCFTFEQIIMPPDLMGLIQARSRFARIGISVHLSAGFINPSFHGAMPLQIKNNNNISITIYPYTMCCQLILLQLSSIPLIEYGKTISNPFYKANISQEHDNLVESEKRKRNVDSFLSGSGIIIEKESSQTFPKETPLGNTQINITGEMIHLDSIIVDIGKNISSLNTNGSYDFTKGLSVLFESIKELKEINASEKADILNYLKYLSQEANEPQSERNTAVIKATYNTLSSILSNMGSIADVWGTFGEQITDFFDL